MDGAVAALRKSGSAVLYNDVEQITLPGDRRRVTWKAGQFILTAQVFGTIEEYRQLLSERQFSFVLDDGALFQMSYTFRNDRLVAHRLAYHPCPFPISLDDSDQGLLDLVNEQIATAPVAGMRQQSVFRFDYDIEAAAVGHSASHLHISRDRCRIPVHAPLSIAEFLRFIFAHFYYDRMHLLRFCEEWARHRLNRCLSPEDRGHLHLFALTDDGIGGQVLQPRSPSGKRGRGRRR